MNEINLSMLEQNESLIHSMLDCSCLSGEFRDEQCIVERLKELLLMRAGLAVPKDIFETARITTTSRKEYSSSSSSKDEPWTREDSSWGYGSFSISEDGYLEEANASGMFSQDLRAYSILCEMLIDYSFEQINSDSIKEFVDTLDDERFVDDDFYQDLCNDDDADETMEFYRDCVIQDVINLWDEIMQAKKNGLSDDGDLFTLMKDYSQILSDYMTPSDCFLYLEDLMQFTFGIYAGANRTLTCYANQDVCKYLKIKQDVPDCYEKRLLDHCIEHISSTCEDLPDYFPIMQFSHCNDNWFITAIATVYDNNCSNLYIRHPFWMLAVSLIDTLAPICISKVPAAKAA